MKCRLVYPANQQQTNAGGLGERLSSVIAAFPARAASPDRRRPATAQISSSIASNWPLLGGRKAYHSQVLEAQDIVRDFRVRHIHHNHVASKVRRQGDGPPDDGQARPRT